MCRDEKYFFELLKNDIILETIFIQLGNMSVIRYKEINHFQSNEQQLDDFIVMLAPKLEKSKSVIQHHIDTLIKWGLIKYVTDDEKGLVKDNENDINDNERLNFFTKKGFPCKGCSIILTDKQHGGATGTSLYRKIVIDDEHKKNDESFKETLSEGFNLLLEPYENAIEELKKEIEKTTSDFHKSLNDGIVKNIQVLSIFAGMISLLFANIMGIKEFTSIGVIGLLVINLSMIMSIFILLLFTKWIIIGEKVAWQRIIACVVIILFLLLPIILIKIGVLNVL